MTHERVADRQQPAVAYADGAAAGRCRAPWARELAVLAAFLAAGVAATWPLATYITGACPSPGCGHLRVGLVVGGAPDHPSAQPVRTTTYMAAPVGLQLGYHTLVPLLGVVMTPVTLAFGPSAAYNLLTHVPPACPATPCTGRPGCGCRRRTGAIAAGAFFGLSAMLTYQDWYHINIAYGTGCCR